MRVYAVQEGIILNATQIQKILYIIYGYFLAEKDHKIIKESPTAWPYGPVFSDSQKHVRTNERMNLKDKYYKKLLSDEHVKKVIEDIISKYHIFSAQQLSSWSHQENGPWDITVNKQGKGWNAKIKDDLIINYFKEIKVL